MQYPGLVRQRLLVVFEQSVHRLKLGAGGQLLKSNIAGHHVKPPGHRQQFLGSRVATLQEQGSRQREVAFPLRIENRVQLWSQFHQLRS